MKLSLSWILDHIDGQKPQLDDAFVGQILAKFNSSVAEVDGCEKLSLDLSHFTLAKASQNKLFSFEFNQEIDGSFENLKEGSYYLLKKNNDKWQRAILSDLGSCKDGIVPEVAVAENLASGLWKKDFEVIDYIFEVDNKSVNHRPDLWGHRGFAREIVALFDLKIKNLNQILQKKDLQESETKVFFNGLELINEAYPKCKRFAALDILEIKNRASDLKILTRLARIDSKPIDLLVDLTNYVMFDIGQPMHAFDSKKIDSKKIIVRFAKSKEKLKLLDGSDLELSEHDVVVADGDKVLSLAGIMGGLFSGVTSETKGIILEAANFDAATIRKAAERAKIRTEASSRFEKNLDPNQNIFAIERYLQLLKDLNVKFVCADKIVSVGNEVKENQIKLSHKLFETQLGVTLSKEFIKSSLASIGFIVEESDNEYLVTVPSFRQGVSIPEDLVEEVGRLYGFENIPQVLPERASTSTDHSALKKLREIKKHLAFSADMMEVCNYPLYDEQFFQEINWQPKDAVEIANPVSENWKRLATSLIPVLLKNIFQNLKKSEKLNFFEVARTWSLIDGKPHENKVLAGVFYSDKKIDFYSCKVELEKLFKMLGLFVEWKKASSAESWYCLGEVADLFISDKKIGTAGNLSKEFLKKSFGGSGFAFEFNTDVILGIKPHDSKFKAIPKYQATWLDISMMIPKNITVESIENVINKSDNRIYQTELIDIFEKAEWGNKKSIAVRFHFVDEDKTLDKEEIDSVLNAARKAVEALGAEIR